MKLIAAIAIIGEYLFDHLDLANISSENLIISEISDNNSSNLNKIGTIPKRRSKSPPVSSINRDRSPRQQRKVSLSDDESDREPRYKSTPKPIMQEGSHSQTMAVPTLTAQEVLENSRLAEQVTKSIPKFEGKPNTLNIFLREAQSVWDDFSEEANASLACVVLRKQLLAFITKQIKGEALSVLGGYPRSNTWKELKAILINNYVDIRDERSLSNDLKNKNYSVEKKAVKAEMYQGALDTFRMAVQHTTIERIIRQRRSDSLDLALGNAREEENFMMQFRQRAGTSSQQQSIPKNSPVSVPRKPVDHSNASKNLGTTNRFNQPGPSQPRPFIPPAQFQPVNKKKLPRIFQSEKLQTWYTLDFDPRYDGLIGMDLLRSIGAIIDIPKRKLITKDTTITLEVSNPYRTTISTGESKILLIPVSTEDGTAVLLSQEIAEEVYFQSSLIMCRKNEAYTIISNQSTEPKVIDLETQLHTKVCKDNIKPIPDAIQKRVRFETTEEFVNNLQINHPNLEAEAALKALLMQVHVSRPKEYLLNLPIITELGLINETADSNFEIEKSRWKINDTIDQLNHLTAHVNNLPDNAIIHTSFDDFIFGVSSSSHQIEGAWNVDGKSENVWDHFTHNFPEKITDGSNGDIACDSYHKYKKDVALLKKLGVNFYRFSLSWSRILPTGFSNKINQAGIDYYNNLINELLANGIQPVVTIYHWDHPLKLQALGGMTNPLFADWFEDYSRVVFENFGDRVKFWLTINEPRLICVFGYSTGVIAPGIQSGGIGEYLCSYNAIKAHARSYHLYDKQFRQKQKGRIGLPIDCQWNEPETNSTEDINTAERALQFQCGFYGQPIFSKKGDYPQVVKDLIANRSKIEGFFRTRLPLFTPEEVNYIKGTSDFIALNHYTTFYVAEDKTIQKSTEMPSSTIDSRIKDWQDNNWIGEFSVFKTVPWGFRKILKWLKDNYGDLDIYVTENGFPNIVEEMHDKKKIDYMISYLSNLLDAIYEDGVKVKGYGFWSLLDSFEWMSGYTMGFGLHRVDFNDPKRTRIPRESAKVYADIIKNRKLTPVE
ncbi:hypothetical protein ILUMI_03029 [Ignelater luminosus]|uniref:Beta-glucosidase n=1 Tax=Ignelater luminosus TaxID=2038154 RepID=A0A8K0DCC2_IGNLU|nr:hypothetical protein ILUMI_03029 [Ignelater luminosus]